MRRRHLQLVLTTCAKAAIGLIAVLIAAGCRGTGGETGPLALYRGEPNADDGLTAGTLEVEAGCVYIATRAGDKLARSLVVFPSKGTRWDAERQAVLRKGTKPLVVGTKVEVGGGESAAGVLPSFKWRVPPDQTCDSTHVWVAGSD